MGNRILITGASIAGNTAVAVLANSDFEVAIVERAEAFRGGQNVGVRGVGREVIRGGLSRWRKHVGRRGE